MWLKESCLSLTVLFLVTSFIQISRSWGFPRIKSGRIVVSFSLIGSLNLLLMVVCRPLACTDARFDTFWP